jgi:hypothetical protein
VRRVIGLFAMLLLLPSVLLAQSKGKSSPAPSSNDGERVVLLDEQMANIVDSDKGNCDKMATDIKAFADKNGAEMQRLRTEGAKRNPDERAAFMKKYGARIHGAEGKMNAGIPGCIQNPKVKAALAGLNAGGHAPAPASKR